MSYEARKKQRELVKEDIDFMMSFFPKDYSEATISMIRANMEARYRQRLSDYQDAFCEDNDICPMCITGGWNCDSDHK